MKSLYFPIYYYGNSGLCNCLMSLECGIGLAYLMNRTLLIDERLSPPCNIVNYGKKVSNKIVPMLTDLYDIPIDWQYANNIPNLDSKEIIKKNTHFTSTVFYFPNNINLNTDEFKSFSKGRNLALLTYNNIDLCSQSI